MKKLIFTLAALLMAGNAMADRVVTFNAETDYLGWVDQIVHEGGWTQNIYEMSKDGVTIRLTQSGDNEVQEEASWSFSSNETLTITSDLYGQLEDVPYYEAIYGGISNIEITCANVLTFEGFELLDIPTSSYEYYESFSDGVYDCYFISDIGHMPELVRFSMINHAVVTEIKVTLNRVDPITPPDDPTITPRMLTIYDGQDKSSLAPTNGALYDDEYSDPYTQMIYPAEMLTDMVGKLITQVKFYSPSIHFSGGQLGICVGTVEKSNFDDLQYVDIDLYGFADPVAGAEELVFNLAEPFVYEGGNLALDVFRYNPFGDALTAGETYFYGVNVGYNASLYVMEYEGDPYHEALTFLPKVTFAYEDPQEPGPGPEEGFELILIDQFGNEVPYPLNEGIDGDHTTTVTLKYYPWGEFFWDPALTEEENEANRPNVPFYFMINGKRYGAEQLTPTVLGYALQNPLTEGAEDCYYVPVGFSYTLGVAFKDGDYYVYAAISKATGVDELNAGKTVAGVRYYNMAGQEMQQPSGMTIVVTTYNDGTTSAVKVMK